VRLKTMRLVVMLVLSLFVAPLNAEAQPPQKMPRIGLLCPTICGGPALEGFLQGLHEGGTGRARTSSTSLGKRRADSSGSPISRRSWFGSTWT
jgi:hypothetical protein